MAWLPDTNVWIQLLKNRGGRIEQELLRHSPSEIRLCSIVKAELWHGAHKYQNTEKRLAVLEQIFAAFQSLPFDDDAAIYYAEIRHNLEKAGCVIGPNDLKIAAICRANSITLVTSNTGEFQRVRDLEIEVW